MRIIAAILLAGCVAAPIATDFVPPSEQEVAILASGLLRLAEDRDQARQERDEARQELARLQRQMRLFCMRMNDL
jgi:outer membrane murein-binding lipoprotein Lpp